jgi:hypothetical protein
MDEAVLDTQKRHSLHVYVEEAHHGHAEVYTTKEGRHLGEVVVPNCRGNELSGFLGLWRR